MTTTYKWHEVYKTALLETDWSQMNDRVRAAKSAIQDRKRELSLDHGGTLEENQAIAHAIHSLEILGSEAATWTVQQKSKEAS